MKELSGRDEQRSMAEEGTDDMLSTEDGCGSNSENEVCIEEIQ